jgi:hypothetical protein
VTEASVETAVDRIEQILEQIVRAATRDGAR